jgi:hypothetical protein
MRGVRMEAELRVLGGDPVGLEGSLLQRLRADDELHGKVRRVTRAPGETELGGALDFVEVALTGGTGIALLRALTVWLRMQRSDVKLSVQVGKRKVDVEATNLRDVQPMLREVLGLPPEEG